MPLPTLLVIDVQRAFDDPAWEERNNPDAEKRVRELLAAWRAAGAPLVHVRHESASPDGLFRRGTTAFEFKPEAEPLPGEPVVEKRVNSAFIGTDLEERQGRPFGAGPSDGQRSARRPKGVIDALGRRAALRHVLEDPAEIAEAHGGIYALGHLRGLQSRRLTAARVDG